MPTRVSLPDARRDEVLAKLARTTAHLTGPLSDRRGTDGGNSAA
jgi:hypothetical protein